VVVSNSMLYVLEAGFLRSKKEHSDTIKSRDISLPASSKSVRFVE
jgi:hypothetical protein